MMRNAPPKLRIAYWLKWQIYSGRYAHGTILPTASFIADRFGVNINTVLSALGVLREEGLISMGRGKDIVVTRRSGDAERKRIATLVDRLKEESRELKVTVEDLAGAIAMRDAPLRALDLDVWYVDADHPNFDVLCDTLRSELFAKVRGVKLEDIESGAVNADEMAQADIVLAPVYYYELVSSMFEGETTACIPMVAKLAWKSFSRLLDIPANDNVVIACKTDHYAQISRRVLARSGLFETAQTCSLEQPRLFLENVRKADWVAASPPAVEYINNLDDETLPAKVISIGYDFDHDSIYGAQRYLSKALQTNGGDFIGIGPQ